MTSIPVTLYVNPLAPPARVACTMYLRNRRSRAECPTKDLAAKQELARMHVSSRWICPISIVSEPAASPAISSLGWSRSEAVGPTDRDLRLPLASIRSGRGRTVAAAGARDVAAVLLDTPSE